MKYRLCHKKWAFLNATKLVLGLLYIWPPRRSSG